MIFFINKNKNNYIAFHMIFFGNNLVIKERINKKKKYYYSDNYTINLIY